MIREPKSVYVYKNITVVAQTSFSPKTYGKKAITYMKTLQITVCYARKGT